jgi:hypothetical protein
MTHFSRSKFFLFLLITTTPHLISPVDNPHYYKAPYFNGTKSWKTEDWLATLDAHYSQGSSRRSRNSNGDSVGAFDLYGNHNLLYLTSNVPQPSGISSALLTYVTNLEAQRASFETANPADKQSFGQVQFHGKCEIDEFVINYRQNFVIDFFAELNIPIRRVRTGPFTLVDQSPSSVTANNPYTQTDNNWSNFLTNFEEILQAYGLSGYMAATRNSSLGDMTLFAGWQNKFSSFTSFFEYIDFAIKAGVLFPTGTHRKFHKPFSFETGYNSHWGVPIRADIIFRLSPEIYWGAYAGIVHLSEIRSLFQRAICSCRILL